MDLKSLNKCRKEEELTDFTIFAEGVAFPVHRLLLHQRSDYFKLLFKTEMKEKAEQCSEQKDVTAIAVERVLEAVYGEDLVLDEEIVADVLKVCHLWMLQTEVETCREFLLQRLALDTCISTRKLATLYSMDNVGRGCDKFIVNHLREIINRGELTELDVAEVRTILTESVNEENSSHDMWDFCLKWGESKKESGKSVLCEAIKNLPAEQFDVEIIRSVAWPNPHIRNCAGCKENIADKLFSVVNEENFNRMFSQSALFIPGDSSVMDNCLFVKKMAKLFVKEPIGGMANDFILQNYSFAFACKAFVDIDEEDLLEYVREIGESCSMMDFSILMQWLQKSPDREGTFPKLFGDKTEFEDSRFLSSLRTLKGRKTPPTSKEEDWLLGKSDCFFVKRLAEKYGCNAVQSATDSYISQNIETVSSAEFARLPFEKVTKYIESAKAYISQGQSTQERFCGLWRAVRVWRDGNQHSRNDANFEELLKVLPFDEASLTFLKSNVLQHLRTPKSKDHVLNTILDRAIKMETAICSDELSRRAGLTVPNPARLMFFTDLNTNR